jgi:hypothetical protein
MTVGNGTILVYVLASIGLIIAFLLAAFVIGWFIDRLRERRRGQPCSPHCRNTVGLKNSPAAAPGLISDETDAALLSEFRRFVQSGGSPQGGRIETVDMPKSFQDGAWRL